MSDPTIVWFRQDLRLADNPALAAAATAGGPMFAVYILDDAAEGDWGLGGAIRVWLHHALDSLGKDLEAQGSKLFLAVGKAEDLLPRLAKQMNVGTVYFNRRYEADAVAQEKAVEAALKAVGVATKSSKASLIFEPGTMLNKSGTPFKVFGAFWRHCQTLAVLEKPPAAPARLPHPPLDAPKSPDLNDLKLKPKIKWDTGIETFWAFGEAGAHRTLARFVDNAMGHYEIGRNIPGKDDTSRMSPYLHMGEISPRQIWWAVHQGAIEQKLSNAVIEVYLREIIWREFGYQLLYHFPHTVTQPLDARFEAFPWGPDKSPQRAWQQGQTGYPIVDAGMRQLWTTGWMHNRVRMIVASFLIKHLMQPWQDGSRWFWDTLVDADLASNSMNWQWVAGSGADASPYFRIFNPMTQGKKFDPQGNYIRQWVPELARLDNKTIHEPWTAKPLFAKEVGFQLGLTYPERLIEHTEARDRALDGFADMRRKAKAQSV